ncbi:MAG: ATP-binding cassette domain-containing protein [Betaproteobacteria bacterium]|nr:ATP-binding cassette domain-containing protein [Betaproteobacteria bacterium]
MLEVESLEAGYGKKTVLQGVSLRVDEGEIVSLLGHNGAGKSTTLKTILGLLPARGGRVRFAGEPWASGNPVGNVRRGIALVPQGRGCFPDLSVHENLMLGAYTRVDRAEISRRLDEIFELFPILAERRSQRAGTMSGGQQQMVAVGTALMQHPRLMMLDEPSIGLAPVLVQRVLETAVKVNRRFGTAILLVEQNIRTALEISQRAYVMKSGAVVLEKPAAELLASQDSWWALY